MKQNGILTVLLILSLALSAQPVLAAGWYIGGGIESVSFGDDLSDVDAGSGITLSFGYRFSPMFALDFLWGGSTHNEDLGGGEAAQGNFLMGAKFCFNDPYNFQPYLTVGLAGHAVEFDYFQTIDGSGIFAGFGADIFIDPNNSINIGFRSSSWSGEDNVYDYDVTTGIFSVVYNFHFLQY